MGKLDLFEIILDNSEAVYYAGQSVSGHIKITLSKEMKMRGIHIEFHGGATVYWTETRSSGTGKDATTETDTYRNSQTYFHMTSTVFGKAPRQKGPDIHLPAGSHSYHFHFALPGNLPSSFEGIYGRVRFCLKATIDKPWKFNHRCKRPVTVISVLDLNLQPNVTQAQIGQKQKTLCCLCCMSGPISADFHLDRRGYVPGEFLVISGEICNLSNRKMKSSSVNLVMKTDYIATTKTKTLIKTVSKIEKGKIAPGDTEVWSGDRFLIPPLPPTLLPNCDIINIYYIVVLSVTPSGPGSDLKVPLEVVIGTIPLSNVASQLDSTPPSQLLPNEEVPPSYAECVLGKVDLREEEDNEYTRGEMNWAPSYPYYNRSNPQ